MVNDLSKKIKVASNLMLAAAALALVLVITSFDRGMLTMMHYICPISCVFAGICICIGSYRKQVDLCVGVVFVGWYVLSRILMKEVYLNSSFGMFSNLCCAYLLAFPFARSMVDSEKKIGLQTVSIIFVIGYGLLAWVGIFAVLTGSQIILPYLGTKVEMQGLRLCAGNHPNISACVFMVALLLGVWLLVHKRCRWLAVPVVLLCVGAYAGIALADSRTIMLQVCCFAAGLVFLAMLRLPRRAMWQKTIIGLIAGALCLVLVFFSFSWVKDGITCLVNQLTAHAETVENQVVANRSLLDDLATMTGRTPIYQKLLHLVWERPRILLTGMLNSDIVQVIRETSGAEHAHNSFLQTLLNMGLPGLLMAVFFAARAVWVSLKLIFNQKAAFADQILAVILLVFLVGTISEPYLFSEYLTAANMPFFLIFGYALETQRTLRA